MMKYYQVTKIKINFTFDLCFVQQFMIVIINNYNNKKLALCIGILQHLTYIFCLFFIVLKIFENA